MPRRWRSVCVVLVCVALSTGQLAASVAAADTGPEWARPVPGAVLRPFQEPIATYAAGHRGVDFAAPSGVAVRAANSGVVSFAGSVAGALHVVVNHANGIRTSYSFLLRVDVHVGQQVQRGQVLGAAGGAGDGHVAGVFHLGARIGDRYIDPMLLFQPTDLTQLVRLVPVEERNSAGRIDSANEARELAESMFGHGGHSGDSSCGEVVGMVAGALGFGDEADSACDALGKAVEQGLEFFRDLGAEGADLARKVGGVATAVVNRMREFGETLGEAAAAVATTIARFDETIDDVVTNAIETVVLTLYRLGVEAFEWATSCPQPDPIAHPVGSGNFVMAVGGQGSSRKRRADGSVGASMHFEARVLGYHDGDVSYFSYSATSATYDRSATYEGLHEKARLLGEQIKVEASAQPGRHLDLVGHSQGGVVIDLFLQEVYRGHESEYPPIENVVTFASPHEGTPSAELGQTAAESPIGPVVEPTVDATAHIPLGSTAMREVSSGSTLIKKLWERGGPPRHIRYLSIMGSLDPWVPSVVGDVPGKQKIVVPVGAALLPDDHSAILSDSDALSAAQAHLSGGSPADTCGPLVDAPGAGIASAEAAATSLVTSLSPFGPPDPTPFVERASEGVP